MTAEPGGRGTNMEYIKFTRDEWGQQNELLSFLSLARSLARAFCRHYSYLQSSQEDKGRAHLAALVHV